jgi:hypothetical protein
MLSLRNNNKRNREKNGQREEEELEKMGTKGTHIEATGAGVAALKRSKGEGVEQHQASATWWYAPKWMDAGDSYRAVGSLASLTNEVPQGHVPRDPLTEMRRAGLSNRLLCTTFDDRSGTRKTSL